MTKQNQMTEKELDRVSGGATMVEYALIVANTVDYDVKSAPTAKPPLSVRRQNLLDLGLPELRES